MVWAGEWQEDPGDEEILARAHGEGRILVTLDKDFGALAVARRMAHSGIVRIVGQGARRQAGIIAHVIEHHGEELAAGAVVTAEADRLRIRSRDQG